MSLECCKKMEAYAKKHLYVFSACRLTIEGKILLLQLCKPGSRGRLSYRKAFVNAVTDLAMLFPFQNFIWGPDTTIINNPKKTMISSKLFGAVYARPEEVRFVDVFCPNLLFGLDKEGKMSSNF